MVRRLLFAFLFICLLLAICQGYSIKRSSGGNKKAQKNKQKIDLKVGDQERVTNLTNKQAKKVADKEPTTDVIPQKAENGETDDNQTHSKALESGETPKYPLNAVSAEVSAHSNEIGGCRDHPAAKNVCSRCGNKCFAAERETYTYSYCRRSCKHCDAGTTAFHRFWRLRAVSEFEPTWMLKELEFYPNPEENMTLVDDPQRAFASTTYTGYNASYAFDKNMDTAWYPSGWGVHDNNDDWIAYEFSIAVRIHAVKMVIDESHRTATPQKIYVEASEKKFGPYVKKWTIHNPTYDVNRMYRFLECPVLWRRYDYDTGAWCFRLMAKFVAWENAKKECEIEGGQLATVLNKEEKRFIVDEIQPCGNTWIGLSHVNQAYFWNDGTNATFRSWKSGVTYSDVQKANLNCVAMDTSGEWENFHCSNKFYFLCKRKLVDRSPPDTNNVPKPWPYEAEIPPVIFLAPNFTVPVINSRNLEPGQFPDANGNVEETEEEEKSIKDLFYEQTVEHLKEKGLKPSEDIENDEDEDETNYTEELNKIAMETKSDGYKNETDADKNKPSSVQAHKGEEKLRKEEENDPETEQSTGNQPVDNKADNEGSPVPGPPNRQPTGEEPKNTESLPKIVNGKPVNDNSSNSNQNKQTDSGSSSSSSSGTINQSGQSGASESGESSNVTNLGTASQQNNPGNQNSNQNNNVQNGGQSNNNQDNNGQQKPANAPQPQQTNNNNQLSDSNSQQANNNNQQSNNSGQQSSSNNQQSGNSGQQSGNNGQQSTQNGQQSSTDNQQSNNNGQQSNNSGQQPTPNSSQGSSTTQSNSQSQGGLNSNNGPSVMGGKPPSKVPEPPPTKEGDKDDEKQDSVGEQSDEKPANDSESDDGEEKSDDKENTDDDSGSDSDSDDNNDDGSNKDESESIPEKPNQAKPTQGKKILEEKDVTNGGIKNKNNGNQKNHVQKRKFAAKKAKSTSRQVQKKSKTNKAKKHHVKVTPTKRTKVEKVEVDSGSGSGDQGDEVELDNILDSITNDLW